MADKEKKTAEEKPKTAEEKAVDTKAPVEEKTEEAVEKSETDVLKEQVAEYKDKWMRAVAEFDNYKKRNASLYQDAFFDGKKEALLRLLPIGDNLETAITMIADENSRQGVELLLKQFYETVKSLGAEPVDPTGTEFSPDTAEAVMQVEKQEGDTENFVKQTFRKGYRLNGKMVRYAQVSVIK